MHPAPMARESDAHRAPARDMMWIPSRRFYMGSNHVYPEEIPEREVEVAGFWIDRYPVTNARFARFVGETGYVTFAERAPRAEDYPDALPEMLRPGSLVFAKPAAPSVLHDRFAWWRYVHGADWRHPTGPGSSLEGRGDHPVVHVTHEDAVAFAAWESKCLPTEAEWELAARGGLDRATYAWGNALLPAGRPMANYAQDTFPHEPRSNGGYDGTSPVGTFPANGYGLYDMIGNVWEWTDDWYRAAHQAPTPDDCCHRRDLRAAALNARVGAQTPHSATPSKVVKGGSYVCAAKYCRRYRPAARLPEPVDSSTSHIGFRCIVRRNREASR